MLMRPTCQERDLKDIELWKGENVSSLQPNIAQCLNCQKIAGRDGTGLTILAGSVCRLEFVLL